MATRERARWACLMAVVLAAVVAAQAHAQGPTRWSRCSTDQSAHAELACARHDRHVASTALAWWYTHSGITQWRAAKLGISQRPTAKTRRLSLVDRVNRDPALVSVAIVNNTWLLGYAHRKEREALVRLAPPPPPPVSVSPWQQTVDCENSGSWSDSPGYFYLGLQFDPGTWRTAAEHTGRWGTSPADQVANAVWTAQHATRDPWPNCPDPYFG